MDFEIYIDLGRSEEKLLNGVIKFLFCQTVLRRILPQKRIGQNRFTQLLLFGR